MIDTRVAATSLEQHLGLLSSDPRCADYLILAEYSIAGYMSRIDSSCLDSGQFDSGRARTIPRCDEKNQPDHVE